jgi:hypothetical protein
VYTRQPQRVTNLGEGTISQRVKPVLIFATVVALLAASALASNPIPVINAPLSPGSKTPGSAAFTLTVNGTGFVSGATVYWNGNARTTTFVSSSQVTATINAADVATATTGNVTVGNPAPGGGFSNVAHLEVVKGGFTAAYSKLDYATDITPQDVTTADFNGDGIADLAVPTGNNTVSILLGKGDGTFPTHVEYGVPGHPIVIATGDFNGDGKVDLVMVAGFLSQVSVLLGNGDGTFQTHVEYATGSHPDAIAVADVNGDGKLDLIVADFNDGKIAVLLGNGDGTFQSHVDYACGNGPAGVAIGDFNKDGKLDVAVAANTDGAVDILLGNGDGTFQAPIAFPTAINPNSVVTGDFNGDGKLDLAVGTSNKAVSVLLGNGDGTFQNHKEYAIGSNAVLVTAADMNSDGKLDLVSANTNDNSVSVLIGKGDGTFNGQMESPVSSAPVGLTVGDFNNNGKLDIAVAATNTNTVSVLTDSNISLSPSLLAFGKQTSGFSSAAKTVTLKNNGTTSYTMGTISFGGSFSTDFTQTTTCGSTVAAGASCTFSVVFDPQGSESADAQLVITNSNGSIQGVQLTGNGNVPIMLSPRTIVFQGYTLLGTTAAGIVATFTNESGVPITFSKIDSEGLNAGDFPLTYTCPVGSGSLAGGASCTATISFTPTITGGETTTLVFYGSFTLAKQGSAVSGKGTAVKVSPTSLTFPATTVGTTSAPMNVTFQNAGSTPMAISSIVFTGTNDWQQTNTCNFPGGSVPANSSCTISVTFSPGSTGTFTGTMKIGDPDPTGPQIINLSGTGQ